MGKQNTTNKHEIMVTVDEVRNILSEAHISAEVEQNISRHFIEVTIEWGDWKHDHGHLKYLMQQHGMTHMKEEILEEYGSDCYSARHIFGEDHFVQKVSKLFRRMKPLKVEANR